MKKLFYLYLLSSLFTLHAEGFTDLEKVHINLSSSKLTFIGKKVTGEHTGNVLLKEGNLNFKGENLIAGEFVIDMNSITNTDIADKEYHEKFLTHIKSPDFFDVANNPIATLKIKNVKKLKDQEFAITADLTIKKITKTITFNAKANKKEAQAHIVFDRTLFGIKFKSGKYDPGLGDKLIYDDVIIDVALTLNAVNAHLPKGAH